MDKKIIKEIDIPHALIILLERLDYEISSYQSLLIYAINHDLYQENNFKQYQQEYLEKYTELELLKERILYLFMPEEYQNYSWKIFYQKETLCIYED